MLTFLDVFLLVWLFFCWLLVALPYPWFVALIEAAIPFLPRKDHSVGRLGLMAENRLPVDRSWYILARDNEAKSKYWRRNSCSSKAECP